MVLVIQEESPARRFTTISLNHFKTYREIRVKENEQVVDSPSIVDRGIKFLKPENYPPYISVVYVYPELVTFLPEPLISFFPLIRLYWTQAFAYPILQASE